MKLRQKEVPYMGHLLSSDGLKPDPAKVEAVTKMPRPEDVEGVQRLNGFVTYLAKFLPKLSEIMEPIRRLTRKDTIALVRGVGQRIPQNTTHGHTSSSAELL